MRSCGNWGMKSRAPMISRNELRPIVILEHFTDEMLDKLIPITDLLLFDEKEFIFRQGEKSECFYMLKQGKVLLELKVSDKITISVSAINPGFSFGWSAMLEEQTYTSNALCSEPCQVLSIRTEKLKALFDRGRV